MGPDSSTKYVPESVWWKRLDQAKQDLKKVEIDVGRAHQRLDDMDRRHEAYIHAVAESRGDAKAEASRIEGLLIQLGHNMAELSKEISRHRGGFEIVKLGLLVGIPTIGAVLTAVTIFG